eukprot:CAMPEP_0177695036 /NCGR_PEP_ID=MMETSP0484_2-20121128/3248_1 /TAXON_ID=354590 /ORGANISM="Rhodomonas lens, Strain RHODO" /LENGTH=600 /DNA_ID=CAMNT_0019205945 /DNA_START=325 /DNA_END=2128 /DNA_ORIENTATION=+
MKSLDGGVQRDRGWADNFLGDDRHTGCHGDNDVDGETHIRLFRDLFSYSGALFETASGNPSTILQVGTSKGVLLRWLQEQPFPRGESRGVEFSAVTLEGSPWPELLHNGILQEASVLALPVASNEFDLVYICENLGHVPTGDLPTAIRELVRVSKGRILFLQSFNAHLPGNVASRGWWDDQFAEAGCIVDLDLLGFLWHDVSNREPHQPQPWQPYSDPFIFAYRCFKEMELEAARRTAQSELAELRSAVLQAGNDVCGSFGWCDLFDPALYWAIDDEPETEILKTQSSPGSFTMPDCWMRGEPWERQRPDCLWMLRWWRSHAELVYSKEEFDLAHEAFAADASLRWEDVRQALPHRGSGASPSDLGSCAVVGSSWVLTGSGLGAEIDGHDSVFRINDAPVEGYQRDVGARTTHRVIELACFQEKRFPTEWLSEIDVLLRLSAARRGTVATVLDQFRATWSSLGRRSNLISRSFTDEMQMLCLDDHRREWQLTTGMLAILIAVHACKTVDTYGFGGGINVSADQQSARYKYWGTHTEPKVQVLYPWHGWERENDLHNRIERGGGLRRRFGEKRDHQGTFSCPAGVAESTGQGLATCHPQLA